MQIKSYTYKSKGVWTRDINLPDEYYLGDYAMDRHVNCLLSCGWELVNSAADSGHLKIGDTSVGAAFTGGLSLLSGGSRLQPSITLTFKKL